MMLKRLSLIACLLAVLCGGMAEAADGVRSAQRDGYGRVVFDWDAPVRYSAEVVNGTLVVQFERPIGGNVAPVVQAMAPYITTSQFSADRRTLTFMLRPNITMRTFTVGTAVVVDLVSPQAAQAASPSAPRTLTPGGAATPGAQASAGQAKPAAPAGPAAAVTVRTGAHPDYFRVAFDWPARTGYKIERRGDRVALMFDAPGAIDIAALNQRLPPANRPAVVLQENGRTTVTFPLAPQFLTRDLATANTIALDLTTTPTANTQANASQAKPAAPAQQQAAKPAAPAPAAAKPPAQPSAAAAALMGRLNETTEVDASGRRVTRAANANRVDPLTTRPAEVSLTIPWDEPAAAAVFRRADYLWVVFDRYKQVDVAKLAKDGAPYITFVEQLPYRNNTILRMVTRPDINPSTRRDGMNWVLDFRALPLRPTRAIEINAQLDRPAPNLFLPVGEAGRTVAVEDPEVGDYLLIVPVIPISYGIYPEREFTDLDMPITAQGVVIIPKSDGVRAQASRTGIDIDVDGGMALSRALASSTGALGGDDRARILNIADWQIGKAEDYTRNKQALQHALGDERPDTRQEARFRLARFEFVNNFYPEVLGILRVMKDADPEIENTGPYRALRGATNMMMRRYQESADDFNHFTLANDDDARFWLAAARAKISDPAAQAQTLIQTGSLVRNYPRPVKIPLALIGVDATIAAGDDFGAQGFLDMIRKETPSVNELAAIDYMDGKLNQKIGELQVALQQYRKAEESQSLLYSVLATRDRLELEHRLGTVSTAQLIEGLEKLRYRWRGDDIELDMLLRLADLYVGEKDYGTALRTLKITTSYFVNDPRVDEAAGKMAGIFEELYLNAAADKLSPVTSIALFDEFRSLVPPGEKGDEMIRRLADRLVSVDLLDQAAVLLERQVQFRVTGVDRSRIGARLALVYLLNKEPQRAIDTLNDTQTPEAGRDLNAQRRRLEARALTDLNKVEEAVLLLGTDTTPETKQLRAEIYWRAQDWNNAARALSEMVPDADVGSLSDANARLVLDWATALTLAGDERTLVRVRQRYTVPMGSTPYKDAFVLITTPRERGVMDIAAVRQQIEQVEQFKSFMVEYKDMIGQNPLSAIN
jgi:tetratricopeptide (TPR) repeat protein